MAENFYGSRGSARASREDASRRHLRAGMAKVALQAKMNGRPEVDCRGTPLKYANRMADGHGAGTLERWSKGQNASAGRALQAPNPVPRMIYDPTGRLIANPAWSPNG